MVLVNHISKFMNSLVERLTDVPLTHNGIEFASSIEEYRRNITIFIAFQLIAASGLTLTVLTAALNRSVRRMSTWYSFIISWIISSVSYAFLTLGGVKQDRGEEYVPPFALCLVQSALVYGVLILLSLAKLSFVTHTFVNLRSSLSKGEKRGLSTTAIYIFLVGPYIVFLALFLWILLYGISYPEIISLNENGMYCQQNIPILTCLTTAMVLVITLVVFSVEVLLIYTLYKYRQNAKQKSQYMFAVAARLAALTILAVIAIGSLIARGMAKTHIQVYDIVFGTLPLGTFLIFGTQMDLVRSWMFWRPKTGTSSIASLPVSPLSTSRV